MDVNGSTHLIDLKSAPERGAEPVPVLPAYLIVLNGGVPGAMLRLAPGETRLGRAADNTFQLPDADISRHHAVLTVESDGQIYLTDLDSTNGTFLNARRVPSQRPVALRDGDRIQFGSSLVVKFARPDACEEQFQRAMFERSVRDGLTGLFNRSFFLSEVGLLADRGALRGLGLAILMVDLDHFKKVNDTFGHATGDVVLREVAGVLRQVTRSDDLVARYGGEEFIVALPVLGIEQALERAERVRESVASRRIRVEGWTVRVTCSIGLAFAPAGRLLVASDLIHRADQALYQAKRSGRNQVVRAAIPPDDAAEVATDEVGGSEDLADEPEMVSHTSDLGN
jgi:two-component system cell cycle response regulator